jgi:DNA invertase Pin-like site-specific DNA recombinase
MPDANPTTIGIMAILAQYERERISANTRAALGVLKSRGVKLGGVRPGSHKFSQADSEKGARTRIASYKDHLEGLRPEIEIQAKRRKATQKERARALNKSGCLTWSGKRWDAASYVRAVKSLGLK